MKKTLLSFFMFVATIATALASDVTFDFVANPWGLTLGSGSGATAEAGNVTEITQDGVVLTFDQATASTPTRMWAGPQLRAYKNSTMTMTAPEGQVITKVVWTATGASYNQLAVDDTDIVAADGWSGSASSVTFTVVSNGRFKTAVVTLEAAGEGGGDEGGEGEDPEGGETTDPIEPEDPVVELNTFLDESFSSSQGSFTLNDVTLPEGSTYVWKHDSSKGYMKASAYVGGASKASESWLTSPVIDLTGATNCIMTFEHCANYFNTTENFQAACSVKAKAEGDVDWTTLTPDVTATGTDWNWVVSTVSLADFSDKKIQIAFVYTSTTEVAGTWEVKNVEVAGVGGNAIEIPEYTSIMELKDNSTADATAIKFIFTDLLVTGASGKYAFVTDGQEGMLFYGTHTLVAGDKISGTLAGDLTMYNGMTQVANPDFANVTVTSQGNAVTPVSLTIDQITQNSGYLVYESMLVNLDNVYFTAEALASRAVMMKDENANEIKLYDNFNKLTEFAFDTNKPYNVTAVVAQYKGTPQVYVLSVDDIKVITNLQEAVSTWASESVVILKGEEWNVTNAFTTTSDAAATFSSSNEEVATVDAEGNVTVVGYGYAEITAETAETENFLSSKAIFSIFVIEGEGTLENPYTVADAQYYNDKLTEKVWVKGTIVGYYYNNAFVAGTEAAQASNIAIGTETLNLPVQLKSGSDVRKTLNLVDNPDKLNTEVWLYGDLQKYFSVAGLKNVTDCSVDGENTLTAIESVKAETNKEQVIYSISGQRLSQPMKGINIINGKKIIVK
ncbi:MAG: choice-of-anchor J domain-containing protein [Paraprevotella sp.]|nr:choice-of-anchor J domain-containing protein [Paraprevotella sp.]